MLLSPRHLTGPPVCELSTLPLHRPPAQPSRSFAASLLRRPTASPVRRRQHACHARLPEDEVMRRATGAYGCVYLCALLLLIGIIAISRRKSMVCINFCRCDAGGAAGSRRGPRDPKGARQIWYTLDPFVLILSFPRSPPRGAGGPEHGRAGASVHRSIPTPARRPAGPSAPHRRAGRQKPRASRPAQRRRSPLRAAGPQPFSPVITTPCTK